MDDTLMSPIGGCRLVLPAGSEGNNNQKPHKTHQREPGIQHAAHGNGHMPVRHMAPPQGPKQAPLTSPRTNPQIPPEQEEGHYQLTPEEQHLAMMAQIEQAGRDWEKEFFGEQPGWDKPYVPFTDRISFGEAVMLVINNPEYRWDPRKPKTDFAKKLFKLVQKRLPDELKHRLMLFCSLHSRLDYQFNGDGFFTLKDKEREMAVLIDLTTSNSKSDAGRHIVVRRGHFFRKDPTALKETAARIAARLIPRSKAPNLSWMELKRSKYKKLTQNQQATERRTARNVKSWKKYDPRFDEDERPLPSIYENED